jgi:hypothetical protein
MLLVTTPVGVVLGLYEAARLAGGLVVVMAAMIGVLVAAAASVVTTVRREEAQRRAANAGSARAERGDVHE